MLQEKRKVEDNTVALMWLLRRSAGTVAGMSIGKSVLTLWTRKCKRMELVQEKGQQENGQGLQSCRVLQFISFSFPVNLVLMKGDRLTASDWSLLFIHRLNTAQTVQLLPCCTHWCWPRGATIKGMNTLISPWHLPPCRRHSSLWRIRHIGPGSHWLEGPLSHLHSL